VILSEEDSLGLSRACYAKDLRWHKVSYLAYGYELELHELGVGYYMWIYLYTYVMICNVYYLLLILWHALILFLGLEIIHWARGSSNPPFISFFPRCESIGLEIIHWARNLFCDLVRLYIYMYLKFESSRFIICKYWVCVSVLCNVMYYISFESLYKAMWADHLLGRCHLYTKLVKYLYPFCYAWLFAPGEWPVELCTLAYGRWVVEMYICWVLSLSGLFCKALSLGMVQF